MAATSAEPYNPSFLFVQDPNRFGGMQEDYLQRSARAIAEASKRIRSARENKEDLKALFFELIADFSKIRGEIAKDHKTNQADSFGKRRDRNNNPKDITQFSDIVLGEKYQKYLSKMLGVFSQHLKQMELPRTPGKFKSEHVIKDEGSCLNSTYSIEVLTGAELAAKGYCGDLFDVLPPSLRKEKEYTLEEVQECIKIFSEFKKTSPEEYHKKRVFKALMRLNSPELCPSPAAFGIPPAMVRKVFPPKEADKILGNMKSLYVIGTLETEIAGKMKKMTTYLTWMYENHEWLTQKDPAHHPIERMKQFSKVMILHQDYSEIQETLDVIAEAFVKAVTWERGTQSIEELKDTMALLMFLATQDMRDERGTAAENEWLEASIYGSFSDLEFSIDRAENMVDLEAFTHPLFSDFKAEYHRIVHVR